MFRIILLFLFLALFPFFSEAEETIPPPPMENQMQNIGRIGPFKYERVPGKVSAFLPDISVVGTFAGGYFRDDPGHDLGENPSRTGFNFQGIELGLQSVVDPYIRADIFILFLEEGVEVEDATVTTLSLPLNLQIRAGKMLAKFGRQNAQHLEQLDFVDYSQNNRYFFSAEGFSELGVELSILFPTSWFSELTFEFLQGENEGNFNGTRKGDFAWLGRWTNTVDLSPDLTLQTGLNSAFGFNASGVGNLTQIYATDLYLRWRPSEQRGLKWQTEYLLRTKSINPGRETEGGITSQLIGQWARRWESGVRFDAIGLPEAGPRQWQLSPVITFLASDFFRVRGQYNFIKTSGSPTGHEAFLQLQFNMGSHGAHAF